MSLKNENKKIVDSYSKKKENIFETLDSLFSFGIFSLIKYQKLAEENPKKAYFRIFIPIILGIVFFVLLYLLYGYLY